MAAQVEVQARALDVERSAQYTGMSTRKMGQLLAAGIIPHARAGRRRLVAVSTLDRYLAGELPTSNPAAAPEGRR